MAAKFASKLPPTIINHVRNIMIVGAGGTIGKVITQSLLTQKKHTITALTRAGSKSTLPQGLADIKAVDYDSHSALVTSMKGQDALIITMTRAVPPDTQMKLIDAAVEAGVRYIMPNEYGIDISRNSFGQDKILEVRKHVEEVGRGKTHWIGLCCGFWYEFSLNLASAPTGGGKTRFGFDFEKKTVTFFDEGNTKISISTWKRVGEAVAKILALNVLPMDEKDTSLTLKDLGNGTMYVNSSTVSQRDMFESVLRVRGEREADWKIEYENAKGRYERAVEMEQGGDILGMVIRLYTSIFLLGGGGNFEEKVVNQRLDLMPKDLDEATRASF